MCLVSFAIILTLVIMRRTAPDHLQMTYFHLKKEKVFVY